MQEVDDGRPAEADDEMTKKLRRAFKIFDKNGDGKIDKGELKALLSRMGNQDTRSLSDADVQELINDFDDNGDGVLEINEIITAWRFITNEDNVDETLAAQRKQAAAKMAGRVSKVDADGRTT